MAERITIKEYHRFTDDRYREDVVKAIERLNDEQHDRLFRCGFAYYDTTTKKIEFDARG